MPSPRFSITRRRRRYAEPPHTPEQDFYRSTLPAVSQLLELRVSLLRAGHPSTSSSSFVTFTKHVIAYGDLSRSLVTDKVAAFGAMGVTEQVRDIYIQVVQGAASDIVANVKGRRLSAHQFRATKSLTVLLDHR